MGKKSIAINFTLVFLIIILIAWDIIILNKHSTMGDMLTSLNLNIKNYENYNNLLNQEIASASSMATVTQKAQEYGLVSTSRVLSLTSPVSLASDFKTSL